MSKYRGSAPGKIILSGEYAVVFGHPGIAVPSSRCIQITFIEDPSEKNAKIQWNGITGDERWTMHLLHIIHECQKIARREFRGTVRVHNELPLGKGMGSSTALLIAAVRCFLGEDSEEPARALEDLFSPGHSGIDFTVIWDGKPVMFQHGKPTTNATISMNLLKESILVDSGTPNEPTPELVAWIRSREEDVTPSLEIIGKCTERLFNGDEPMQIFRDHHRAQVRLGVVPHDVQELIERIERLGGAAKVTGAGAKTGGGGIVIALHPDPEALENEIPLAYPPMRP